MRLEKGLLLRLWELLGDPGLRRDDIFLLGDPGLRRDDNYQDGMTVTLNRENCAAAPIVSDAATSAVPWPQSAVYAHV